MGGKHGVKNTKEVLTLGQVVTVEILKKVKEDGFQVEDLLAFLQSEEFAEAVGPAVEEIDAVDDELSELDLFDGLDLAKHAYGCVQKIIDALKKMK